jgi:AraC-like DNA-binding protein
MDPLSDVLSLVKPRSYASAALTAGGCWALRLPASETVKCYAVVKGQSWVAVDGVAEPVRLAEGDCLILPHARGFRMGSDLTVPPLDALTSASGARYKVIRACASGDDFLLLASHFVVEGNRDLLLRALPPVVHLRTESDKEALRGAVERMMKEMREPRPGGDLMAQQTAYTMLVLALRLYLAEGERRGTSWLSALADEQIARALAAIHDEPAGAWTVQTLAEKAGMSRTAFAARFRRTVGASPLEYLTQWRMRLASDRLRHSNDSISVVAQSVGYASESAFGAAFKRAMGASPREHARASRPPEGAHAASERMPPPLTSSASAATQRTPRTPSRTPPGAPPPPRTASPSARRALPAPPGSSPGTSPGSAPRS